VVRDDAIAEPAAEHRGATAARSLRVLRLGRVEYEDGLALQAAMARARRAGAIGDVLMLLEHPPVITLGRGAHAANVLASPELLARRGVSVYETDRGGDVTYHGPGQLVGYPILDLAGPRADVRAYVRSVEEGILRALSVFGLDAGRIARWPGVWLGADGRDPRKIAAIGVHIARWITTHGFALNVGPALEDFELIVPCGIAEAGVTSMARELGSAPEVSAVETALAEAYASTWESELEEGRPALHTVSVAVTRAGRGGPEVLLLRRIPAKGGFWQLVTGRREAEESAAGAAERELREETGRSLAVRPLDYRHVFALGEAVPPLVVEEEAFAAVWEEDHPVRLGPEHDALAWVPVAEALQRLPFAGLRRAVQRATTLRGGPDWR
jgi:lipoyl(octanoyl) transferase